MAGGTPNNEGQQHANLPAAIREIRRLQAEVAEIQKEKADEIAKTAEEENIEVSQPLAQQLWDAQVPPNVKIP
jgi:phage host-nuclease inhibitor protein Gam